MGFEPTTLCLGSRCATTALHPPSILPLYPRIAGKSSFFVRGCARNFDDNCRVFAVTNALESTLAGPDCANLRTGRVGVPGSPYAWGLSQAERVQDWHSLVRHGDLRVHLADHAANTICPLLTSPKISGRTPHE